MKKFIILLLLTSCTTTIPVTNKFPEPPTGLEEAPILDSLAYGSKGTDMLKNHTLNTSIYYILKAQYDSWLNWYKKHKELYK
jgi:hypothetical protein